MFENIRKVLDEEEKYIKDTYKRTGFFIRSNEFDDKLALALYDDVNVYWLSRKLKMLSDEDVPSEYKSRILRALREEFGK